MNIPAAIPITVTIPVGPNPSNRRWLDECLLSVMEQEYQADEILIIDDQAGLSLIYDTSNNPHDLKSLWKEGHRIMEVPAKTCIWKTPWLSGVAHAFNFGVALARNPLVVMLGSDDLLQPWALSDLKKAVEEVQDPLGYYYFLLEYMDTGEWQDTPCNAAAVTQELWRHNGGFPVESAIGAPDTMLLSIMFAHKEAGRIRKVESEKPAYLYRRHAETDTATRPPYPLHDIRDIMTKAWKPRS